MKPIHYQAIIVVLLIIIAGLVVTRYRGHGYLGKNNVLPNSSKISQQIWTPPDTADIPKTAEGDLIRYGRQLIVHTAIYFGPKGTISRTTNGLDCQDCHLEGGTRIYGNNFSKVASSYPEFRARKDGYVSMADRVNGCMERSMNGEPIDTAGKKMKAFIAYFKWLGKGALRNTNLFGEGTEKLPFMNRAADPVKGKIIFIEMCQACHGKNGGGQWNADSTEYRYPPLWGTNSYNTGAGLYRLSEFAGFVKNNMPFGTTYHNPVLTDEQAWDVAAYVNSRPHPTFKKILKDWPNITAKPFDYPFGPYADSFSKKQHKYGPFTEILKNK